MITIRRKLCKILFLLLISILLIATTTYAKSIRVSLDKVSVGDSYGYRYILTVTSSEPYFEEIDVKDVTVNTPIKMNLNAIRWTSFEVRIFIPEEKFEYMKKYEGVIFYYNDYNGYAKYSSVIDMPSLLNKVSQAEIDYKNPINKFKRFFD